MPNFLGAGEKPWVPAEGLVDYWEPWMPWATLAVIAVVGIWKYQRDTAEASDTRFLEFVEALSEGFRKIFVGAASLLFLAIPLGLLFMVVYFLSFGFAWLNYLVLER
jgi:hypothetical protein